MVSHPYSPSPSYSSHPRFLLLLCQLYISLLLFSKAYNLRFRAFSLLSRVEKSKSRMTALLRRSPSDLASMSRAAQRKQRLLEIEKEQRLEDAEALKMTEEQRQILLRSFTSVKVEFSDLDGLKWTHSALRKRMHGRLPTHPPITRPASPPCPPDQHTFVILTNADLDSFSAEDTIRASRSRRRPSQSTPPSHTHPHTHTHKPPSTKSRRPHRSPIRNFFSLEATETETSAKDGHGAKRRRCSLSGPLPLPLGSPTPTQPSFPTRPSTASGSRVPSSPCLHHADDLPSPTAPTVPISKSHRPSPTPGSSPPCESGFPPGLGEHGVGVDVWAVEPCSGSELVPMVASQPRVALSLDYTSLSVSARSMGMDDGDDVDVVPPTPRPRDFVREELPT